MLICAIGQPAFIEETVDRLVETGPKTRFRLMTDCPVEVEVSTAAMAPEWEPSVFDVEHWFAVVFLTDDENCTAYRNALAHLIQRCRFRRAYLCESHFVLIDITRHTRTPHVSGRSFSIFFHLEPETWSYLYHAARDVSGPGVALEIGSFVGGTAVALAIGSRVGGHPPAVAIDPILVDGWTSTIRASGCLDFTVGLEATSESVAARWSELAGSFGLPPEIRLLFIDGNHEYEAVLRDLDLWSPRVTSRGRIVVHDAYNPFHPGVARALHRWLKKTSDWRVIRRLPDAVVCARC